MARSFSVKLEMTDFILGGGREVNAESIYNALYQTISSAEVGDIRVTMKGESYPEEPLEEEVIGSTVHVESLDKRVLPFDGRDPHELMKAGYFMTSRKHSIVSRVDVPDEVFTKWLSAIQRSEDQSLGHWRDHFRRVCSKDHLYVPNIFKKVIPNSSSEIA